MKPSDNTTKAVLTAKTIGETYERNRYEVHTRSLEPDASHEWRVYSRNAKTIEEAREQIASAKANNSRIAWLISFGRVEFRIVKVTARCEIVE